VTHDRGVVDRELIEQPNDALRVSTHGNVATSGAIAAPVAEEIDHDDPVPFGNEWDYLGPEVGRCRKPVKEDDRLAGATTAGSIVIEPRTVYVDELTPHVVWRSGYPDDFDSAGAFR
jgi:hypothetical protein